MARYVVVPKNMDPGMSAKDYASHYGLRLAGSDEPKQDDKLGTIYLEADSLRQAWELLKAQDPLHWRLFGQRTEEEIFQHSWREVSGVRYSLEVYNDLEFALEMIGTSDKMVRVNSIDPFGAKIAAKEHDHVYLTSGHVGRASGAHWVLSYNPREVKRAILHEDKVKNKPQKSRNAQRILKLPVGERVSKRIVLALFVLLGDRVFGDLCKMLRYCYNGMMVRRVYPEQFYESIPYVLSQLKTNKVDIFDKKVWPKYMNMYQLLRAWAGCQATTERRAKWQTVFRDKIGPIIKKWLYQVRDEVVYLEVHERDADTKELWAAFLKKHPRK